MTCEEMNKKWGAPGRIVFRPSPSGAMIVSLANQYGSCEVDLFGARVTSYRPTGQAPVVYMPPRQTYAGDAWTHGGIPVCWPWFGRNGPVDSGMHGFARHHVFQVRGTEYSEDATEITLAYVPGADVQSLWDYASTLEVKVTLSMKLTLAMTTTNRDTRTMKITEGFHPYFAVMNRDQTVVRGVNGCTFCDARISREYNGVWTGDIAMTTDYDHVFQIAKPEYALLDNKLRRAIGIVSRGNRRLVVWNPGPEDPPDGNLDADSWTKFVCVEPATIFRDECETEIKPGESHTLVMAVQSTLDGLSNPS